MMIQVSRQSARQLAATLVASLAIGWASTGASHATAGTTAPGLMQLAADVPAGNPFAAPTANSAVTAPAETDPAPADRSVGAGSAIAQSTVATKAAPDAAPVIVSSGDDSSGWDKASFVGRIFIACGTLLTLGSAARMFMV